MRDDAPPLEATLSGLKISASVDVWYAGRVVAHNVPVGAGTLVSQVDQDVPERLDAFLPREWEGVTLDPGSRHGVLGAAGHRLQLTVALSTPSGSHRWAQARGRFLVQSWERDGASIRIMGNGALQSVKDRLRARPWAPGRPSPIAGEVMSILSTCGLDSRIDPGLSTTRRVPADFVQGENLWAALQELLVAWPARARMDDHGAIRLLPGLPRDLPGTDVIWTDGADGTVIGAPSLGERDGVFNHVIVRVKPEGDGAEFAVEDHIRTGWLAVDRFGWKSGDPVESDAITTRVQAELVAANTLATAGLRAKTVPVEMVPDWGVELDDVRAVKTADGVKEVGRVTGIELPLNPGGTGRVDVGVVS